MPLSTYNGYEYFDYDPEYDDPMWHHAAEIVEILASNYTGDIWVTFKDYIDIEANLRGRVYRNPGAASLHRLYRTITMMNEIGDGVIKIEHDDRSPIIIFERN